MSVYGGGKKRGLRYEGGLPIIDLMVKAIAPSNRGSEPVEIKSKLNSHRVRHNFSELDISLSPITSAPLGEIDSANGLGDKAVQSMDKINIIDILGCSGMDSKGKQTRPKWKSLARDFKGGIDSMLGLTGKRKTCLETNEIVESSSINSIYLKKMQVDKIMILGYERVLRRPIQ